MTVDPTWQSDSESYAAVQAMRRGTELHIWRCNTTRHAKYSMNFWNLLWPDEQKRALRFRFEKHRIRFVLGRGLLRVLLAKYAGQPPERLILTYNNAGKPSLKNELGLTFSVSHTDSLCVYSIGRMQQHGIDIESRRAFMNTDEMAERALSLAEREVYWSANPGHRSKLFLCWWTQKEAYLKALGTGLTDDLNRIDCVQLSTDPTWTFISFRPNSQHFGALCSKGRRSELRFFDYSGAL